MNTDTDIDWHDVIKKEARGLNDADFGEVQEVSNGLVLTQRGRVNKEIFSIPQTVVESYDGKVLRFRISEEEAINKYVKNFTGDQRISNELKDTSISSSEDTKIDAVVENVVDDTIEEALISPTAEEVELDKKVERERTALVNENSEISSINEYKISANKVESTEEEEDSTKQDQNIQNNKSMKSKIGETMPLKKEEAGIS